MPQVIPFLATAAGAAGVISATTAAWLTIAASVAVGLYERDKAQKESSRARRAYNDSLQDRLVTIRSAVSERTYVLGTVRTSGTLMYAETVGLNKTALDSVVALACNKCELTGYYFGDEFVAIGDFPGDHYGQLQEIEVRETFPTSTSSGTFDLQVRPKAGSLQVQYLAGRAYQNATFSLAPTGTTVTYSNVGASPTTLVATYKIDGSTRIRATFKDGSANQTPSEWVDHATPLWTENHLLKGVAHLRTLMLWDENLFAPGAPVVGAVLKGGWIEAGGADEHRFYDPRDASNPVYTDNPALLAGWWMTLSRSRGGCGIPFDWIEWDSIAAAANVCDELITVRQITGGGYEQIKRYQCHTVLSTARPPLQNLQIILGAMNGRRAHTGGLYRIVAGAFRPATFTIGDRDIIANKPLGLSPIPGGKDEPANIVTGRFADATTNWQESQPKPVINPTYVTSDRHESPIDINLPATTDPRQANYLQGVTLEASRPAFGVTVTVGGIGEDIALLDTVGLSVSNRPHYTGKTFEVVQIAEYWDVGQFELQLSEIRPQIWALDADRFTPTDPAPIGDVSYLWNVAPVTNFEVDPGTPQTLPDGNSVTQLVCTWDAVTQPYVHDGGRLELRYRDPGSDWIDAGSVPGDSTGTTITASLIDGSTYQFQIRAINGIGAASRWTDFWLGVDGAVLAEGIQGPGIFTWAGPVGVTTTSSSITKSGASGAWNAGAYSLQSYSVGAFVTARPGETTTDKIIGLNNDPDVDANFVGINFALRARADATIEIYESGILLSAHGAYTAASVLSATYDGLNVRYFRDGVVLRTTPASGLRLFLDVSLFTLGASWLDVAFGPQGGAGAPGAPGASAQSVRLSASSYIFTFDAGGNPSPAGQTINFTASRQNIVAAASFSTTPVGVTLGGSGDARSLTVANFGGNQTVRVRVDAGGFFDEVTIQRLTQGSSTVVGLLTNEAHTLAADPDGVVGSFAGANGLFLVYEGIVDRTALATFSIQASSGCTAQINTAANTPVAGQPRGFYRVTAVTSDQASVTLRAVYSSVTVDKQFTVTRARRGEPGAGANLLALDEWIVGTAGSQATHWNQNGATIENAIVLGGAGSAPLGPLGITEPLWECRPALNDGPSGGADGGWEYPNIAIDRNKTWRSVVWFRVNAHHGQFYHGCGPFDNSILSLAGVPDNNAYFAYGHTSQLEVGQWYMSVGIIHGAGYTSGYSGIGGVYDPRTGKKIPIASGSPEFKFSNTATLAWHRAYHYYNTTSSAMRQWMARPRFEEINGNEPSIYDLMGIRLPVPWIERGNCLASQSAFIKSGGVSQWDSDVISIQSFQDCHLQIRPGQTTGYFMVGLNTDPYTNQSYETLDFAWYFNAGGALQIYESGVFIGDFGTYTSATECAITYDDIEVVYYKDRVVHRRVLVSGARFYEDCSFHTPGAACVVRWGPGTAFETIAAGEIDAIGQQVYSSFAGPITNSASFINPVGSNPLLHSFTYTPNGNGISWLTMDFVVAFATANSNGNTPQISLRVAGTTVQMEPELPLTRQLVSKTGAIQLPGGVPVLVEVRSKATWNPTFGGMQVQVANIEINVRHYQR